MLTGYSKLVIMTLWVSNFACQLPATHETQLGNETQQSTVLCIITLTVSIVFVYLTQRTHVSITLFWNYISLSTPCIILPTPIEWDGYVPFCQSFKPVPRVKEISFSKSHTDVKYQVNTGVSVSKCIKFLFHLVWESSFCESSTLTVLNLNGAELQFV